MKFFKRAFDANNLLGLVFKIMKGEFEDIPNEYSNELKSLIKYINSV